MYLHAGFFTACYDIIITKKGENKMVNFDRQTFGATVLGLRSPSGDTTKELNQLDGNVAPAADLIAAAPMGSIWFKASPASGDYAAFIKTGATTVSECMAIA